MKRLSRTRASKPIPRFDADSAVLAVLIGAMASSGHVESEEGARAHNIVGSMRRFRSKSKVAIRRNVERVSAILEANGIAPVIDAAAGAVPARIRPAIFAVAADVLLVDGRFERSERRFLGLLATSLGLDVDEAQDIIDVMRVKNSA